MTIRHMKIFVAVYQEGNITRAAERLHLSQPGVTRAIQELESYYGVRLFERINRRLSVTETGKRFYAHALHIADSFDTMEKGLRNWDEFGVLRVGATITLGTSLLPDAVAAFQHEHPNLRLEIQIFNGAQLQRALLNNQLDIALIEGGVSERSLVTESFATDRLLLIFAPDDPLRDMPELRIADLAAQRFLLRECGSVGRTFLNHVFAAHGIVLTPLWESASTRAIIRAVAKGIGISFLPEQLVKADLARGIILTRDVADESFRRENHFVWHEQKFLSNSAKAFMAKCRDISRAQGAPAPD